MGVIANAALERKGKIIGVIPENFGIMLHIINNAMDSCILRDFYYAIIASNTRLR